MLNRMLYLAIFSTLFMASMIVMLPTTALAATVPPEQVELCVGSCLTLPEHKPMKCKEPTVGLMDTVYYPCKVLRDCTAEICLRLPGDPISVQAPPDDFLIMPNP